MWFTYDEQVNSPFPTVGMIGLGQRCRMSSAPASALGVDLIFLTQSGTETAAQVAESRIPNFQDLAQIREFAKKCDLITYESELVPIPIIRTLESEGFKFYPTSESLTFSKSKVVVIKRETDELSDFELSVLVARSPHGQAATWAPVRVLQPSENNLMTIAPSPELTDELSQEAQQIALKIAAEIKLVGVMAVKMFLRKEKLFVKDLVLHPHESGYWTIDGSVTSQFEQHLRAILDLPLGDTSICANNVVTGFVFGGDKKDMYRPYLHLMARTPKLKFQQYRNEVVPGRTIAHLTLVGHDLAELKSEVEHAVDYMTGIIDE
jgi:5-(carboxyamino)imidazole ribonucleotide synthase